MNRDDFIKKYKVGDKIKLGDWEPERYLKILSVGDKSFFCNYASDFEYVYPIDQDWIPYTKPQKKKKTVKMAQALIKTTNGEFSITAYFSSSKEELERLFHPSEVIQWPLVINGEEQWITVEVEE